MTLLLIRHGETLLNASRTIQPADTPLSPRGRAQAEALATRLLGSDVQAIVSSDLPRALETAEAISRLCALPIIREPLLQERNFGDLRGRAYDELGFDPLAMPQAPPGGESEPAFRRRVAEAFAAVLALRSGLDGGLAVVTHGLVIGALLDAHAQPPEGSAPPARIGNASLTIITAAAPHRVELLNCTVHLDRVAADDARSLSGG